MTKTRLIPNKNTALVIIDIQEAFRKAIPSFDEVVDNAGKCAKGFQTLGLEVLITEQYPKGLGPTDSNIIDELESPRVFQKSGFSACTSAEFNGFIEENGIENLVVCGIESHVCVNQTVHDLLARGLKVHLVEDAVASRSDDDRTTALKKMYQSGAIPCTTEMALFELLVDSKHKRFKEIQALIKN